MSEEQNRDERPVEAPEARSAEGALTERSVLETIGLITGVLGITAVILGWVLYALDPAVMYVTAGNTVFGVVGLAFYGVTNWRSLARAVAGRSSALVLFEVLIICGVLAGAITVNYFAAQNTTEWDLTRDQLYTLNDQSQKVAQRLVHPVKLVGFFKSSEQGRAALSYAVEIYRKYTDKISVEFVNPDAPPPGMVKKYAMSSRSPRIVVVGPNDRYTKIAQPTEEAITNALIEVSERPARRAYFLTGHQEPSLDDKTDDGYRVVAETLGDIGWEVASLSLVDQPQIPKDATVVILAGAQSSLLPAEVDTIQRWLDRGGRAMFLLEPGVEYGLELFWRRYGVDIGDDLVVDPSPLSKAADFGPESPIVQEFEPHPITNPLRNSPTIFHYARSVQPRIGQANLTVTTLVLTGVSSWGEKSYRQGGSHERGDEDVPGPVPIAAAITKNTASAAGKLADEARIVVVGDHHFATNKFSRLIGNLNLFMSSVEWLAGDEALITIKTPKREGQRIPLTEMQQEGVMFFSVNLLPLLIVGFGFSVWAIRRRK